MKMRNSFPEEVLLIDFLVAIIMFFFSFFMLISKEYFLCIILISVCVSFFGICTLIAFVFSRFYIIISDTVEIRKYFKVRRYQLIDCVFFVKEINTTIHDQLIYILTVACNGKIVLKINSNTLDPEFRTRSCVEKIKKYNHKENLYMTYSESMRFLLSRLGEQTQNRNGFRQKVDEYATIPFYQFRFSATTDKKIYIAIKKCVESFNGNLSWTLMYEENQPEKRLYTIIPSIYAKIDCRFGKRENATVLKNHGGLFQDELYGLEKFNETINLASCDVPKLIDWMYKYIDIFIEDKNYKILLEEKRKMYENKNC